MPGACVSLWPTEKCEWSTWDIWRSSDIVQRALYVSLGLMLLYTFFVLTHCLRRYCLIRCEPCDSNPESDGDRLRNRNRLISDLSAGLGMLRGISKAAPYFGLAGSSYGILSALWFPYSGSPERYFQLLFTGFAFAITTTLAAILVAIPASVFHNVIRTFIENHAARLSVRRKAYLGSFSLAQSLPLKKRFSGLPQFALLAAPTLACVVMLFTPFHPYRVPVGLRVLLPSFPCQPMMEDRILVLRVSEKGELSINTEPVSWTDLPRRLYDIYRTRASRNLYLLAEDGASFQTVVDAADTATRIRGPEFESLDINILLITPQAQAEHQECFEPVMDRIRQQTPRRLN